VLVDSQVCFGGFEIQTVPAVPWGYSLCVPRFLVGSLGVCGRGARVLLTGRLSPAPGQLERRGEPSSGETPAPGRASLELDRAAARGRAGTGLGPIGFRKEGLAWLGGTLVVSGGGGGGAGFWRAPGCWRTRGECCCPSPSTTAAQAKGYISLNAANGGGDSSPVAGP